MSDTRKVTYEVISEEAIIDFKISGSFHKRLVGMYFAMAKKFDSEKLNELLEAATTNKLDSLDSPEDKVDAFSLETMCILIKDIENAFRTQGFTSNKEFEIPTED